MLLNIVKSAALVALASCILNAGEFNVQADKDRQALEDYTVAKFMDAEKNRDRFFPYSSDDELKNNDNIVNVCDILKMIIDNVVKWHS